MTELENGDEGDCIFIEGDEGDGGEGNRGFSPDIVVTLGMVTILAITFRADEDCCLQVQITRNDEVDGIKV